MNAYVICANDSVELVVLGDEKLAIERMEGLAKDHYKNVEWNYADYATYRSRVYWHLHEVEAVNG